MSRSRLLAATLAATSLLALARIASAGLPLLCEQFETGNAETLPWGKGWQEADPRYDVDNLQRDLTRLLATDAPIPARMENLRRAALYTAKKPQLASSLVAALVQRAAQEGPRNRLAWFDAAYLIETYRQVDMTYEDNLLGRFARPVTPYPELNALDGRRMLGALLARGNKDADVEFAHARMVARR